MKPIIRGVFILLLPALLSGCGSNPKRTHRGGLLDDKVTEQRVKAALDQAGRSFDGVSVSVRDGRAVLTGTVRSPRARAQADEIARRVEPVREVEDHLKIRQ
jgi:osmotically-inducible protein OsmY